jgi:hypothetical protein
LHEFTTIEHGDAVGEFLHDGALVDDAPPPIQT